VLDSRYAACRLPSFTEAYTASTPLTRIRDIAHRGDIPHELKQEIKHTIQNKLHRNAGPEDLVRSNSHHHCMLHHCMLPSLRAWCDYQSFAGFERSALHCLRLFDIRDSMGMRLQVATERMIERLEKEGGHNVDFLAEFRTFRSELRDFFNASSLTDMLAALRPSLDEPDMQVNLQVAVLMSRSSSPMLITVDKWMCCRMNCAGA
jgi:phosphoglucan, water dikinase